MWANGRGTVPPYEGGTTGGAPPHQAQPPLNPLLRKEGKLEPLVLCKSLTHTQLDRRSRDESPHRGAWWTLTSRGVYLWCAGQVSHPNPPAANPCVPRLLDLGSIQLYPGVCLASMLREEQRRVAREVDGKAPLISWCVLGSHEVSIENTDERIARKILQTGIDRYLVLTFFPW